MKKHKKRKNNSRKKSKGVSYSETMTIPTLLFKSFVGREDTLQRLLAGYKVSFDFQIANNKEDIILRVTTKHRNHLAVIMERILERYNKIVTITNNLIDSLSVKEE